MSTIDLHDRNTRIARAYYGLRRKNHSQTECIAIIFRQKQFFTSRGRPLSLSSIRCIVLDKHYLERRLRNRSSE